MSQSRGQVYVRRVSGRSIKNASDVLLGREWKESLYSQGNQLKVQGLSMIRTQARL